MVRRAAWRNAILCMLVWLAIAMPARAEEPVLRVAVLKFGTVNWLMDTIRSRELDLAEGFRIEIVPLASGSATAVAFLSGSADVMVTDWIWALRNRASGKAVKFYPYSRSLGALVGHGKTVCDLAGKKVGVVGGADDKSWLVLQALADKQCGMDLVAKTEALFGAPPLMSRQLQDGAVEAVSTYWHFVARLEAAGFKSIIRIDAALEELGISPAPPLIGFVWDEDQTDPETAARLVAAIRKAGDLMAQDDAIWEELRDQMRVANDAEFVALRDAYRAGIPGAWTAADTQNAGKLYALLRQRAGGKFTEQAGPFDPAVFPAAEN